MTTKSKPSKPAANAAPADDYENQPLRTIKVKVARHVGEGDDMRIEWDDAQAVIMPLCIATLGGIFKALSPIRNAIHSEEDIFAAVSVSPEPFFEAVGLAIHWPKERVAAISTQGFLTILFQLIDFHRPMVVDMIASMNALQAKWTAKYQEVAAAAQAKANPE